MARSQVKSKRAADKEAHDINRQREEFRLLAGEWYTGHPVVPATPLRGEEYEQWQTKLDEYVDLFIEAIRLGNVEKQYIDRIPPELKREIGEAIQKSIPGAAPDMKKKKEADQAKKKIERAKEKATAKAKEQKRQESPAKLANQGTGTQTEPGELPGYADPDMGPTIPAEVLAERQEQNKSRFEKLKDTMGRVKSGFRNMGTMAAAGAKASVMAQSPFLRNMIMTYEGVKTAFSSKNTEPGAKPTAAQMISDRFRAAMGQDVPKREQQRTEPLRAAPNPAKIDNTTSAKAAATAEDKAEGSDDSIIGLLQQIEKNTRGDGADDKKKDKKNPLEKLLEGAKNMLSGMINGVKALLNSFKTIITGLIAMVKTAMSSIGKLFGKGGAKGAAKGAATKAGGKSGAKGVTKALPPRDPKTGRFMKATDAAKGAKGASGAATKAATTAAGKTATGTVSKALSKGAKVVPGLGTAIAVGEGAYDAYQTNKAYEAGEITEKQRNEGYGEAAGGTGGALAGAAAGAAIGSVVPVVGTAIGGIVGGVAGYYGGSKAGSWLGGMFGQDKTKKEIEAAKVAPVAPTQVKPKLDGAAQIISSPPPDKATPVEQAVAATNDSVTKLASSLAMVNSKSNTVAQGGGSTSVMIRNSARDHDSTFRRYLFDRSVYA